MKTLLLASLVLSISTATQARSILVFKSIQKCQTYTKQEPVTVDVQEAQDGQSQLVIAYPLKGEAPVKIQTKKTLPPRMLNGGSTVYSGINSTTKEKVTLKISGSVAPLRVGKLVGKAASLQLEKQDEIKLICSTATK